MAEEMTSRERVLAAIKWEDVDRIPVFSQIDGGAAKLIGRKVNKAYYSDGETIASALLSAWEKLHDDVVSVIGQGMTEAFGAELIWPGNDYPMFREPIVTNHEDADRLRVPDPKKDKYMLEALRALKIVRKKVGNHVIIESMVNGIFNIAGSLLGTENLMAFITRDPELVHKVCRKIVEAQIKYGDALVEGGADLIMIPDATSSPSCISPKTYEEFALPYLTQAIQGFKRAGAYVMYHPCGGEYPIIDLVNRTGADILWFSELVDLSVAQKIFVNRTAVGGGVDPSMVLFVGTPQEVKEHVKDIIATLPYKTGAIIRLGCGLSPNFPIENIKAMVDAARKYGAYH